MNYLKSLPFLLLLGACATSPVKVSEAKPVPEKRFYKFQKPDEKRTAKIIVVRDSGFSGSGLDYNIHVDNEKVCTLTSGEKAEFYVEPKEHIISAAYEMFGEGGRTSAETTIAANETKIFRLSIGYGYSKLERMSPIDSGE